MEVAVEAGVPSLLQAWMELQMALTFLRRLYDSSSKNLTS